VEINSSKLELSETAIKAKNNSLLYKLISTYYFTRKPLTAGKTNKRASARQKLLSPS
jgi:hypothetical protein